MNALTNVYMLLPEISGSVGGWKQSGGKEPAAGSYGITSAERKAEQQ